MSVRRRPHTSAIPAEQFSDEELASRSQSLYQIGLVRLDQGDFEAATDAFADLTVYTVDVSGATDLAGNTMAPVSWM